MNAFTNTIATALTNMFNALIDLIDDVCSDSRAHYRISKQMALQPVRIDDDKIFRA